MELKILIVIINFVIILIVIILIDLLMGINSLTQGITLERTDTFNILTMKILVIAQI